MFLAVLNNKTGEIVFEWENPAIEQTIGKDKLDTIKALNLEAAKAKEILKKFGYERSSDIKVKDFAKVFMALRETKNEN